MDINQIPVRKSTRLHGFDYSSTNYYFVTICTHEKKCIFGTTEKLSQIGMIAKQDMLNIESHFQNIRVDVFTVMPNHVHAIIAIDRQVGEENGNSLLTVIGLYKSGVSRKAKMVDPSIKIWQRSFHDHVIRNQSSYEKIWNYVQYNPMKWKEDCFFMDE